MTSRFATKIVVLVLCLAGFGLAVAKSPDAPTPPDKPSGWTTQMDDRARKLEYALRCVMCQSESIADSQSKIAATMRQQVRRMVAQGKSDAQIKTFFVQSYGEFVLMEPTRAPMNWPLWFGPAILVLAGIGLVRRQFGKKTAVTAPAAAPTMAGEAGAAHPAPAPDSLLEQAKKLLEEQT